MKFACLTLSFNQGQFLQEAISSIKTQSVNFEYLIYDPGSTDDSREIAEKSVDAQTKIHFVNGDQGPADGLNIGLKELSGDIFYYLNADDKVKPNAFEFVENYFNEHLECDVLHGSIELINGKGEYLKTLPAINFSLRGFALGYSVLYQQATFIRMSALKSNPFNTSNRISWDGELIVDLAISGKVIHKTNKILGEFRIYENSISGSPGYRQLVRKEHARIAQKILGHKPRPNQKLYAFGIRILKAIFRRIFPRISYI